MPRRIPDYPDAFIGWNSVASFGSMVSIVATILFFYIVHRALTGKDGVAKLLHDARLNHVILVAALLSPVFYFWVY